MSLPRLGRTWGGRGVVHALAHPHEGDDLADLPDQGDGERGEAEGRAVQPARAGEADDDDAEEQDLAEVDGEGSGEQRQRGGDGHPLPDRETTPALPGDPEGDDHDRGGDEGRHQRAAQHGGEGCRRCRGWVLGHVWPCWSWASGRRLATGGAASVRTCSTGLTGFFEVLVKGITSVCGASTWGGPL